jgi:DNA-directed RNA polymerase subunit RPC12/RpoP
MYLIRTASTLLRIIIRKFMQDLKVDPALDAIRCPKCSSIIRLIRMGNTVLNRYICPNCGKEVVLSGDH